MNRSAPLIYKRGRLVLVFRKEITNRLEKSVKCQVDCSIKDRCIRRKNKSNIFSTET